MALQVYYQKRSRFVTTCYHCNNKIGYDKEDIKEEPFSYWYTERSITCPVCNNKIKVYKF